jgi:hypothetical protein
MARPIPLSALAAAVASVLTLALCVIAPPAAAALAPVSSTHPYSDPHYLPLHAAFGLDCVKNNPGCNNPRTFWGMTLVPLGQWGNGARLSRAGIYAMGAGVLHYGNAHGTRCGVTPTSFGTWVWIDHGGGYVSRYGHLSTIAVGNGAHVAAGQLIGVVGTTGKGRSCDVAYTDVEVFHTGVMGTSVPVPTLLACMGSSRTSVTWPSAFNRNYAVWNDVPQNTQFPATTSSCVPSTVPRTAFHPSSTSVSRSGSGQLTVRWARPSSTYHVTRVEVELALRHSDGSYDRPKDEKYVLIDPANTAHEFSGLLHGHTYRARVSFHNSAGWSHASSWLARSVS